MMTPSEVKYSMDSTTKQNQTEVTAYFSSEWLLLFVFTLLNID